MHHHERHGAKQPHRFDPARAAILDDTGRFEYVPPETLLAELDAPAGATVVDFGAGTGLYAIALAQRRPDLHIVALDEQAEMLEHTRGSVARAGTANVEVVDAVDAERLRGTADRVLALNVLHELGDAALADLRSLLTRDGVALFVDWNAEAERPMGPPRDHVYSPAEAARRLKAAGFQVELRPPLAYHYVIAARR